MPHTAGLDSKALKAVVSSHDSAQEVQAVLSTDGFKKGSSGIMESPYSQLEPNSTSRIVASIS